MQMPSAAKLDRQIGYALINNQILSQKRRVFCIRPPLRFAMPCIELLGFCREHEMAQS